MKETILKLLSISIATIYPHVHFHNIVQCQQAYPFLYVVACSLLFLLYRLFHNTST